MKKTLRFSVIGVIGFMVGCVPVTQEASAPAPEGDYVGDCTDQVDNDLDGITDCDDPGCASQSDCLQNVGNDPSNNLVNNGDDNNSGNNGNTGNNNNGNNGGSDNNGSGNTGPCTYPSAHSSLAMGMVAPAYSWSGVYDASGNTVDFSFEDFYCNTEKLAVIMVVVASWCPNCPGYLQYVNQNAASLVSMGAEILYVSAQNSSHALASPSEANAYINNSIGHHSLF